jgi:8-oxo-dGTP pyrophosphatase MutT (NUDIX family)
VTADAPNSQAEIDRLAARVFLVDREGSVLLLRGRDPNRPEAGWWWLTPGGGIDDGETAEAAARREVREETGLVIDDVGEVVFRRAVRFDFEGLRYHQREQFFCVRCDRFVIDRSEWTDVERRSMAEHRWWTYAELAATDETVYPEQVAEILRELLADLD